MSYGFIIQYVLIFIVIFFLTWFATIKILYPFWNLHPVLHPYDWMRHIYLVLGGKPFIIFKKQNFTPNPTKYYNSLRIKTLHYSNDVVPTQQIISLLRTKYVVSPNVFFICDENWLQNLLGVGHNHPCFVSYIAPSMENDKGILDGCCVSYPVNVVCGGGIGGRGGSIGGGSIGETISAYYIDYFTIGKTDLKTPMQTLFETHQYKQLKGNPNIAISFFKKEVEPLLGISPFIESAIYLYSLPKITDSYALKGNIQIRMINKSGNYAHLLCEFMERLPCDTICASFSAILNWIKLHYWFVFIMVSEDIPLAIYFFRDTRLVYDHPEHDVKSVELIGTFCGTSMDENLFYNGFLDCIKILCTKINMDFRLLQIADIGNGNATILRKWNLHNVCIMRTFLGYYFFNYCWKSKKGRDLLILC